MSTEWTWRPNPDATRLHAIRSGACPACGPTACRIPVSLIDMPVTGDPPPRCKRCVVVVVSGEHREVDG